MKKVALVFVLAVLLPSLVLAWLAVRSLRDQQFLLERQQSLIDQHVTDALAQNISDYLAQRQQEFAAQVESLAAGSNPQTLAAQFDNQIRQRWPLAEVGFCVTASGKILSPAPNARPEAQMFRLDNSGFLGNREPVEVYWNANNAFSGANNVSGVNYSSRGSAGQQVQAINNLTANTLTPNANTKVQGGIASGEPVATVAAVTPPPGGIASAPSGQTTSLAANNSAVGRAGGFGGGGRSGGGGGFGGGGNIPSRNATVQLEDGVNEFSLNAASPTQKQQPAATAKPLGAPTPAAAPPSQQFTSDETAVPKDATTQPQAQNTLNYKPAQTRAVSPQSQFYQVVDKSKTEGAAAEAQNNLSKVIPAEAEFSQLIGNQTDGMVARFLQNKLKLMFWHRLSAEPDLIFGAQLNLDRVVDGLRGLIQPDPALQNEICLAVLDDNAKPVVVSQAKFRANWKRPFVATEIGEALPHWEAAAYLVNPAQLTETARTTELTLGLFIAVLLLAIGVGSWLIVRSLNAELKLARQKTDFVSNVSHELKTPLTSIRMFSELLAEQRVSDTAKQRSYLNIITAEAGRLTRLINNVLDFSRMERGEKKYNFQPCDLTEIVRTTAETFRPHLEAGGFKLNCGLPETGIPIRGDADALSQVIVNLLSNAEKYSNGPVSTPSPRPSGERVEVRGRGTDLLTAALSSVGGGEGEELRKEITLQLAQKQSPLPHAEVKILDRGPGVPPGSEEKIFEKFYRAHDSLSSGVQGSGLGLTIARQIARAHGGDVVYEPRDGGGSCFILRLPIKPD
jgi:signal transduction histidine kinase